MKNLATRVAIHEFPATKAFSPKRMKVLGDSWSPNWVGPLFLWGKLLVLVSYLSATRGALTSTLQQVEKPEQ